MLTSGLRRWRAWCWRRWASWQTGPWGRSTTEGRRRPWSKTLTLRAEAPGPRPWPHPCEKLHRRRRHLLGQLLCRRLCHRRHLLCRPYRLCRPGAGSVTAEVREEVEGHFLAWALALRPIRHHWAKGKQRQHRPHLCLYHGACPSRLHHHHRRLFLYRRRRHLLRRPRRRHRRLRRLLLHRRRGAGVSLLRLRLPLPGYPCASSKRALNPGLWISCRRIRLCELYRECEMKNSD